MALKLSRFIKLFLREKHPCPGGQAGQSLFEILIALALVGVVLGLGAALIFAALQSAEKARVQTMASRLAQELMESASVIAGSSWHKIYCPPTGEPDGSDRCGDSKGTGNKYYATSTLMGYWPMDELSGDAVADTSGFGNNGTFYGTSTSSIVDGYAYKARQFNGTSDYVGIGANKFDTLTNATIELWFYYAGSFDANRVFFSRYKDGNNRMPIFVTVPAAGNKIVFENIVAASNRDITSDSAISANTWYHVAFTCGSAGMKMYVNGAQQSSTNPTTDCFSAIAGTISTDIGAHNGSAFFNGIIDEVRIFNRALPQYEIQQHYLKAKDVLSKTPASGAESLDFGNNTYTRWFTMENVSRALADQAIEATYESTRDDPSTQKITVSVTAQRFLATTSIVQYVTRSRNEVYRQTEWTCEDTSESPSPDNPRCYYSASSTIITGSSLELDTYQD